jgi:hypothetical protein
MIWGKVYLNFFSESERDEEKFFHVKFEIFMVVKMSLLFFWFVAPFGLVGTNISENFSPEDGESMFSETLVSACESTWYPSVEHQ